MRVAVTRPIYDESLARLREAGHEVMELWQSREGSDRRLHGVSALVAQLTDRLDADFFAQNPDLVVVANVAVGYDNIDVAAATRANVVVTNTPGVLTDATADLAMALLFAAARRILEGDALVRSGGYEGWELIQHPMGLDISGMTIGIVGMGRVGQAVARRAALGFGMEVLYTNVNPVPDVDQALNARRVELPELLRSSDFVSLHAPLTSQTHHLINRDTIAMMRPSAVLVNTARGPLIDEQALSEALTEGRLGGAALDVFENEPQVCAPLLQQRERVVLTPHVGSATESTRRRMSDIAVENVMAVLAGRPAPNPVTS
jgi:glyoxylate reductase